MLCNVVRYLVNVDANGRFVEGQEEIVQHNDASLIGPMYRDDRAHWGAMYLTTGRGKERAQVILDMPKTSFIDHQGQAISITGYRHTGASVYSRERWVVTPAKVEAAKR